MTPAIKIVAECQPRARSPFKSHGTASRLSKLGLTMHSKNIFGIARTKSPVITATTKRRDADGSGAVASAHALFRCTQKSLKQALFANVRRSDGLRRLGTDIAFVIVSVVDGTSDR